MIEKITERVSVVFTADGFSSANCMLVEDDVRTMIDSGCGRALLEADPARVDLLLCSHHHVDHISGNDHFTAAKILAHPVEEAAMQSPAKLTATDRWHELMDTENFLHAKELGGKPNRLHAPWRVDGEISGGQVIDCGRTKIVVLHTPGHTAGHCSFFFPEEDVAFLADICLSKVGPWYGDSDSSIDGFIASIDRIIDLKPGKVVTGHLNRVLENDIASPLAEYRDRILAREEKVRLYLSRQPSTIKDLADHHFIYRDHPNIFVRYWEKSMLLNHVQRLVGAGEIARYGDGSYGPVSAAAG